MRQKLKDFTVKKTSRQRVEECWKSVQSLVGDTVSMIIRPSVFSVEQVCRDWVSVREKSGRLLEIPMAEIRSVMNHLFRSSRITLHETRVRYSKQYSEFIFGILARLPGVRVTNCTMGLSLVFESVA